MIVGKERVYVQKCERRERVGITIRKSEEMAREKSYVQIKQKMTGVEKIQKERGRRDYQNTPERKREKERASDNITAV